jgi:hypothetical protein
MAEINSCIVLSIEERNDINYDEVETRLFITYDFVAETFVVYGKRQDKLNSRKSVFVTNFVPFFYRFERARDAYQFAETIISKESECSYTVYNYDNMPYHCDTVNYYDLESNMNENYVLVSYDNVRMSPKTFAPLFKMVRNTFNF